MGIVFDKKYQTMPDMPPAQFEALKEDIAERGLLTPIDIDEDGRILDGHHRYQALRELGITDFPTIVRPGLCEEDKRLYSRKTNMMRRHLSTKQIRELIRSQLLETPHWANNRIGQELGVDGKTVKTMREKLETTSEIPKLTELEGADGKVRNRRKQAVMSATEEERQRILDYLKANGVQDAEGFVSAETFFVGEIDYFADFTDEQVRLWSLYALYMLKDGVHPESVDSRIAWLRRKDFTTPGEWIGEEGSRFRGAIGIKRADEPMQQLIERWEQFKDDHKEYSREQIDALANQTAMKLLS